MPPSPEILFTPGPERLATTNAWAFLHWLRHTGAAEPPGELPVEADPVPRWAALRRFAAGAPDVRAAALAAFLRLAPDDPHLLLLGGLALHADLRPDDRLVLAGAPPGAAPWWAARRLGTEVLGGGTGPGDLLAAAAAARATVLVGPASWLAEAAFPRAPRPDLSALRSIVALGGPMAPEARARVYAWIKADVMLLARAGGTAWGNPLSPVLRRPPPEPALFEAPPAARRTQNAWPRPI